MVKRTGARLPLWRFFTPAKAPDIREAAATADVKADFIMLNLARLPGGCNECGDITGQTIRKIGGREEICREQHGRDEEATGKVGTNHRNSQLSIGIVLIQHIWHTQDFPSLPSRQTRSTKWPRPDADAAQPCQPTDPTIVRGPRRLLAD